MPAPTPETPATTPLPSAIGAQSEVVTPVPAPITPESNGASTAPTALTPQPIPEIEKPGA